MRREADFEDGGGGELGNAVRSKSWGWLSGDSHQENRELSPAAMRN